MCILFQQPTMDMAMVNQSTMPTAQPTHPTSLPIITNLLTTTKPPMEKLNWHVYYCGGAIVFK